MPLFNFSCQECGTQFERIVSNAEKEKLKCPECNSSNIKQLVSSFNSGKSIKSFGASSSRRARSSGM